MLGDADAAALLAADHHTTVHEALVDPLEPDGRSDQVEPEALRLACDELRPRERTDDRAVAAAILHEVRDQQREDGVGVHESTVTVDRTEPVGVAVGHEPDVRARCDDRIRSLIGPRRDRLGVEPAERGVGRAVEFEHSPSEA